ARVLAERDRHEDAAVLVDLALHRARDVDAAEHRDVPIEARLPREPFLEGEPLPHRIRDDAGVEGRGQDELVVAHRGERIAIARRHRRAALRVHAVLVAPSKHVRPWGSGCWIHDLPLSSTEGLSYGRSRKAVNWAGVLFRKSLGLEFRSNSILYTPSVPLGLEGGSKWIGRARPASDCAPTPPRPRVSSARSPSRCPPHADRLQDPRAHGEAGLLRACPEREDHQPRGHPPPDRPAVLWALDEPRDTGRPDALLRPAPAGLRERLAPPRPDQALHRTRAGDARRHAPPGPPRRRRRRVHRRQPALGDAREP